MAREGEAVVCSDSQIRIFHPFIHIGSMDAEELARYLGVRSASANVPCPTGLISKNNLHDLRIACEPRTVENMLNILLEASSAGSKTESEEILRRYGLHNSKV